MLLGFYTGTSGIYYNQQKLASIANNLANINTTGFKQNLFLEKTRAEKSGTNRINPAARKRMPSFYGIEREGVFTNFKPGRMEETDNPFHVAISANLSNAFFAVKKTAGNDPTTYYTRNGNLSFGPSDPKNPNSDPVLYISNNIALGEGGKPLFINPNGGKLVINDAGEVIQGKYSIGTLSVYRFNKTSDKKSVQDSNLQSLIKKGESLFQIPPKLKNEFNPISIPLNESKGGALVHQGMKEKSNVNIINELMHMTNTTNAVQSNQSAFDSQVKTLSKLFQLVKS